MLRQGGDSMNIGSIGAQSLYSLKQALGMATMRKAMNQDAQAVGNLLKGMEESNPKALQRVVEPHKGGNVDIKV